MMMTFWHELRWWRQVDGWRGVAFFVVVAGVVYLPLSVCYGIERAYHDWRDDQRLRRT